MKPLNLDKEEQSLLDEFDSEALVSIYSESRKNLLESAVTQTLKKDKRINIRLSSHDLSAIQRRALEEGIPYQTLVSSVLHKFVSGTLQDVLLKKYS
jgi:predicted DNA binding CopG/RHH family protein